MVAPVLASLHAQRGRNRCPAVVRALYDATDGQLLHWRMLAEIDRETADAIEFAVEIRAAVGPLRLAAHATKIEALSTFDPGRQRRPAARRGAKIRSAAGYF